MSALPPEARRAARRGEYEPARLALAHGHSTDTIAGYRVVDTEANVQLASFEANDYFGAITLRHHRAAVENRASAGVIDTAYECGCWSDERPTLKPVEGMHAQGASSYLNRRI